MLSTERSEITAPVALIGPHDQKPVHALSERAEQLRPLPRGKRGEHRVRGPTNEIDLAVAQRLVGLVDGEDQLMPCSSPCSAKSPSSTAAIAGK